MESQSQGIDLSHFWVAWGLFFGFHMLLGVAVITAGTYLLWLGGYFASSMSLLGAGAVALYNGLEGMRDLIKGKMQQKKENCQV